MIVVEGVEMVDVQEAAALTGRTAETVRRWAWSGRVPSVKHHNKLFVPRADLPVSRPGDPSARPSLAEWGRQALDSEGRRGATANDLVIEDRVDRGGR